MQTKNEYGLFNCLQNEMIQHKGPCRCGPNRHPVNVIISNGIPDVLVGHYHRQRRTGKVERIKSPLLKSCLNHPKWECIRIDKISENDSKITVSKLL